MGSLHYMPTTTTTVAPDDGSLFRFFHIFVGQLSRPTVLLPFLQRWLHGVWVLGSRCIGIPNSASHWMPGVHEGIGIVTLIAGLCIFFTALQYLDTFVSVLLYRSCLVGLYCSAGCLGWLSHRLRHGHRMYVNFLPAASKSACLLSNREMAFPKPSISLHVTKMIERPTFAA